MKKNKKYKALMLDLDGTTVQYGHDTLPSKKLIKAIAKAREKIYVGIATGRPYYNAKHIIDLLQLAGPCIFNNGAQVRDVGTGEILIEKTISYEDIVVMHREAEKLKINFIIDAREREVLIGEAKEFRDRILGAWIFPAIAKDVADLFVSRVSHLPTVAVTTSPALRAGEFYVIVNHASATKQHGILEVARVLGFDTHDFIGVGDGDNDFPLLMACGLRVAMGNAYDGLKEIADYVAPTVVDDGVVDVIERFVLDK
jgi:HAD superfamily hydrolase (TIGR01484 family)